MKSFFYEHKESVLVYSVIDNYERVSYLKNRLNKGTERYLMIEPETEECTEQKAMTSCSKAIFII